MAEPLYKSLRPASFRGVPFQVDSADFSAGRRAQLHEYPQRDKPYVEDLGRAAREIRITAFCVGRDYVDQANKLIGALETAGPGTLVHPWLGTLTVALREPASVNFDTGLGVARVSLGFTEAGELVFPSSGNATQAQSRGAAGKIESAATKVFSQKFSVAGMPQFVRDAASGNIARALGAITANTTLASVLGYANTASSAIARAQSLLGNPLGLATTLLGFIGLAGPLNAGLLTFKTGAQLYSAINGLLGVVRGSSLNPVSAGGLYTLQRAQAATNSDAVFGITRQLLLAQAVGLSGDLPITVYQDATALRQDLLAALDTEAAGTASDDVFTSLQDARASVYADLTTRARDSARLVTFTPPAVRPALVTAYDRYEDALRDAEIVERNRIARPGFVPPKPLQLLSR